MDCFQGDCYLIHTHDTSSHTHHTAPIMHIFLFLLLVDVPHCTLSTWYHQNLQLYNKKTNNLTIVREKMFFQKNVPLTFTRRSNWLVYRMAIVNFDAIISKFCSKFPNPVCNLPVSLYFIFLTFLICFSWIFSGLKFYNKVFLKLWSTFRMFCISQCHLRSVPRTTAGHFQIYHCPGARHLPTLGHSRAFDTHSFLSDYNYTECGIGKKQIGSSVKDRNKL